MLAYILPPLSQQYKAPSPPSPGEYNQPLVVTRSDAQCICDNAGQNNNWGELSTLKSPHSGVAP
jgi:hypothetical protein